MEDELLLQSMLIADAKDTRLAGFSFITSLGRAFHAGPGTVTSGHAVTWLQDCPAVLLGIAGSGGENVLNAKLLCNVARAWPVCKAYAGAKASRAFRWHFSACLLIHAVLLNSVSSDQNISLKQDLQVKTHGPG